jgi:hypothetical protein
VKRERERERKCIFNLELYPLCFNFRIKLKNINRIVRGKCGKFFLLFFTRFIFSLSLSIFLSYFPLTMFCEHFQLFFISSPVKLSHKSILSLDHLEFTILLFLDFQIFIKKNSKFIKISKIWLK